MTKKDYIKLARILNENLHKQIQTHGFENQTGVAAIRDIMEDLCIILKQDNPRFDSTRFVAAAFKYQD